MKDFSDYNFFTTFINEAKSTRRKMIILIACLAVFVGLIAGVYYITKTEADNIQKNIDDLRAYISSQEVTTRLAEIREKKNELTILENYKDTVDALLIDLDNANVINVDFLALINTTLPQDVKFTNMIIAQNNLSMNGIAESRISIAELYRNLLDLGIFDTIDIGTISENEIFEGEIVVRVEYTFDLQCMLKGGVVQ